MEIRPARPADGDDLRRIAILTGDAGNDASGLHDDPELIGHVYVDPYLAHQPDLAFVLCDELGVAGYVLAALDVRPFRDELERAWWPGLRARYPLGVARRPADQALVHLIHERPPLPPIVDRFPSELHVDVLPRGQGGGNGRSLIDTVLAALVAAGSPGVHLGVDPRNERALGFYEHLGFRQVESVDTVLFVLGLG